MFLVAVSVSRMSLKYNSFLVQVTLYCKSLDIVLDTQSYTSSAICTFNYDIDDSLHPATILVVNTVLYVVSIKRRMCAATGCHLYVYLSLS